MRQDALSRFAGAEAMWAEGRSAREIADHFGVTRNTIIGMTNRNRDRFPHRDGTVGAKVKRDAVREALMVRLDEMWAAGMTYREMQEAVGRTVSDIISANRHRYPIRERVKAEAPPKPPKRGKAPQAAILHVVAEEEARRLPRIANEAFMPLPGAPPVLLADAPADACRWPVSIEADPLSARALHVCGCKAARGPYCFAHQQLSVGPGMKGEQAAHKDLVTYGRAA